MGAAGTPVSWFYARPLPHIWSPTWWIGSFGGELQSYFIFPIKLCFPLPNWLSELIIWLSITKPWWLSNAQRARLGSRFTTNPETQEDTHSTNNEIQGRWSRTPVGALSFGQTFNQQVAARHAKLQALYSYDFILTPKYKAVDEKIAHMLNDGLHVRQPDGFT